MKILKKIFTGVSLIIGISILLLGTIDLANPNATKKDKEGALAAIVLFSLPSTAIATWLIWSLRQEHQQQLKQSDLEKEQLFLRLLQQEGEITVTKFALYAQISIEEAKQYLDQKAKQLSADFEVSDEGGIIYRFSREIIK
jgi:predicted HTH domain antitoxin